MSLVERWATARVEDVQGPAELYSESIDALKREIVAALEEKCLQSSYRCSDPHHVDHYKFTSATIEKQFRSSAEMRAVYNRTSMELLRDFGISLRHFVEGTLLIIRAEVNYDRIHCE